MKNPTKVSVAAIIAMITLSACGSNEVEKTSTNNDESTTKIISQKTDSVDIEIVDIKDFDVIINYYENDPKYDPETMKYEIYLQKVMVCENEAKEKTQLVVASSVQILSEEELFEKTIAAYNDFVDSNRNDGPIIDAKTKWQVTETTAYSAESIIDTAVDKIGIPEDEMEMYKHYILKSTF